MGQTLSRMMGALSCFPRQCAQRLGGHVLQRARVEDGVKPYVSAQRGSNKH